jgi:Domain of unknown function (DUF4440)
MVRIVAAFVGLTVFSSAALAQSAVGSPLATTVATLDSTLFAAYNACDMPAFSTLFAPNVEFYHDQGGVTTSRTQVIANTRRYICGKVRRELVAGTLEAHPIKDYGAIATGEHRFCELATGKCEGIAKFVIIWQQRSSGWRATRVLSFGHRQVN